jgi:hypothetical protein
MIVLPLIFGIIAGCKDDETPTDMGGIVGGISSAAFPNNQATLTAGGGPVQGALTGGTAPYMINTQPDAAVATAALSGANSDTLTITPVATGNTSVIIEDSAPQRPNSPAGAMVTIAIVVSDLGGEGMFAGTGTLALSSSIGMFSASGTYDDNATTGQGVGGLRYPINGDGMTYDALDIVAYNARSINDADIVLVSFMYPNGSLVTGVYNIVSTAQASYVAFGFGVNLLQNPPNGIYVGTDGSANLATISQTAATGNAIAGSAVDINNPTQTATFSAGTFSLTGIGQGNAAPSSKNRLEEAVMQYVRALKATAKPQ